MQHGLERVNKYVLWGANGTQHLAGHNLCTGSNYDAERYRFTRNWRAYLALGCDLNCIASTVNLEAVLKTWRYWKQL